ncbi:MAG: amidohydrolase family protein [Flavobacteriales bacterium]
MLFLFAKKEHLSILLIAFILNVFSNDCLSQSKKKYIKNVRLFDGDSVKRHIDIAFQNGRVVKIGKDLTEKEGDENVIDGKDKTIIPPLVNAHVHLWSPASLKKALGHGIYAFLDMHTSKHYAQKMRKYNDSLKYADFYSSNGGATVPGGHGTQFGIKVPTINDSVSASQFVRDRVSEGADYIKILREPMMPTINFKQTKEVIETAHLNDKLAIAHVSRVDDAIELAEQKVNGFAHVWYETSATKKQLKTIKESAPFIVPTLSVIKKMKEMKKRKKGKQKKSKKLKNKKDGMSFEKVQKEVEQLHERGLTILAGTDAPNFQLNYTDQLYKEIKLLTECGLSSKEALQAATVNIYDTFDLNGLKRIKAGNPASFILIDGNPLYDLNKLNEIDKLFKEGVELNQEKLIGK